MSFLTTARDKVRQFFRDNLRVAENPRISETIETLRQTAIFSDFPRNHLRDLSYVMHFRDYKRGDYIYYESDPGLGLYIVQRGSVRLMVEDLERQSHELGLVETGGFFGAMSLVGDFARIETAQAVTETRLLGFFRPDLNTIIKRHPQVGAAVAVRMAEYLAKAQLHAIHGLTEEQDKLAALRFFDAQF